MRIEHPQRRRSLARPSQRATVEPYVRFDHPRSATWRLRTPTRGDPRATGLRLDFNGSLLDDVTLTPGIYTARPSVSLVIST
jgi:hypothetical protein